jgi:hypothetical protein
MQETLGLGNHGTAAIYAGQMELRHHLQEQKGVAARAAANVYRDATLVFGKQVSDVLDWLVIGRTDIIILVCYLREMLIHASHV